MTKNLGDQPLDFGDTLLVGGDWTDVGQHWDDRENFVVLTLPAEYRKFARPSARPRAPAVAGNYRIKFKAEVLPLKDEVGGYRALFSHNVQFAQSQAPEHDRTSMRTLARVFPALATPKLPDTESVQLVNQTFVEEVLHFGVLDFGKGITAKANIAIWRERGTHHPLRGEFAYQAKFKRRDELHEKAIEHCRQFFIGLQQSGHDWLSLGTTKTGFVYRLKGNPPQSHERG